MTSREEIALQLTKSIIENSSLAKFNDVGNEVSNVYNTIYGNIETKSEKPMEVLK